MQLTNTLLKKLSPSFGDKFSPYLYQWLKKNFIECQYETKVFINKDGIRYIGFFDEEGWFYGSNFMGVLCHGKKEGTSASYPSTVSSFQEVKDFWAQYAELGRCAIDPEHKEHFRGNTRWIENGHIHTCTWCGYVKDDVHSA